MCVEQMKTEETVKREGFVIFSVSPCQRSHPLFTVSGGLQVQMSFSHCLLFLINSDAQILRSQILNLGSMCGLQKFEDFLEITGGDVHFFF